MKILIIDTSTEKSVVAFANGPELLLVQPMPGLQSSKLLFPTIESGLKTLNMKFQDIEAIAVGVGPGSFTGTRVGFSAAQGLAFPRNLPLVGFCSLSGFISQKVGSFVSIIDARIGGAYILHQERKNNEVLESGKPLLVSKEILTQEYKGLTFVGPSFAGLEIDGEEIYPDCAHLAKVSFKKLQEKAREPLKILYLRENQYVQDVRLGCESISGK